MSRSLEQKLPRPRIAGLKKEMLNALRRNKKYNSVNSFKDNVGRRYTRVEYDTALSELITLGVIISNNNGVSIDSQMDKSYHLSKDADLAPDYSGHGGQFGGAGSSGDFENDKADDDDANSDDSDSSGSDSDGGE